MTFHVRLVSLPDRTNDLVEALAADVGVSNLLVLPGVAREPDGDAVQFDVGPRSANSVFGNLQTFQHDRSGTVAVEYLDATLGEEATPASKHFLVQRDIPPVWEVVEARIRSDAVYAPSFYGMHQEPAHQLITCRRSEVQAKMVLTDTKNGSSAGARQRTLAWVVARVCGGGRLSGGRAGVPGSAIASGVAGTGAAG
jgi:hypothetical protein